jgi:hypothetical protein
MHGVGIIFRRAMIERLKIGIIQTGRGNGARSITLVIRY